MDPYSAFDKKREIVYALEKTAKEFTPTPTPEFIEEAANYMHSIKSLLLKDLLPYIENIPRDKNFPTLDTIKAEILKLSKQTQYQKELYKKELYERQKKQEPKRKHMPPFKEVPGTPIIAETLFKIMKKDGTNNARFSGGCYILKHSRKMTDKDIMDAYEMWLNGEIHDKLKEPTVEANPISASTDLFA